MMWVLNKFIIHNIMCDIKIKFLLYHYDGTLFNLPGTRFVSSKQNQDC